MYISVDCRWEFVMTKLKGLSKSGPDFSLNGYNVWNASYKYIHFCNRYFQLKSLNNKVEKTSILATNSVSGKYNIDISCKNIPSTLLSHLKCAHSKCPARLKLSQSPSKFCSQMNF